SDATLERLASHVTTLNPGQAPHPAHKYPEEELTIVRQGTLEVTLNGQATRVETGGMIFCASNERFNPSGGRYGPQAWHVIVPGSQNVPCAHPTGGQLAPTPPSRTQLAPSHAPEMQSA